MSNFIYPLGIIDKQKVTPTNSVISDSFENGTTMTRLLWNAQNFKRKFELTHSGLTLAEWRYLRSFYSQRSGMYDGFWYRDNVNRRGNANVRFSAALAENHDGVLYNAQVSMDEIAPVRTLPELDEVIAAAGSTPVLWYDANREFYLTHVGNIVTEPAVYDAANQNYPATWRAGTLSLGGSASQYQTYNFTGINRALTSATVTELSGSPEPLCTIFVIAKHSSTSTKQVLLSIGGMGDGHAMGLALASDNRYEPWLGGTESWTVTRLNNSPADTYRSLAVVCELAEMVKLYANAAVISSEGHTRNYIVGPAAFGSAIDGTLIANPGGTMANNSLAHILVFAAALNATQIKALHNLLGYQYGLSIVP
jgi:hypothetical protein